MILLVSKTEEDVTTTDGKKMLVWVIPLILMLQKTQPYCIAKADRSSIDSFILSVGISS
jgi:hypothetical protein